MPRHSSLEECRRLALQQPTRQGRRTLREQLFASELTQRNQHCKPPSRNDERTHDVLGLQAGAPIQQQACHLSVAVERSREKGRAPILPDNEQGATRVAQKSLAKTNTRCQMAHLDTLQASAQPKTNAGMSAPCNWARLTTSLASRSAPWSSSIPVAPGRPLEAAHRRAVSPPCASESSSPNQPKDWATKICSDFIRVSCLVSA